MNKKVFISMLTLVVVFLTGLYIAKIFFPNEFVMSVQSNNLVAVGTYIDNHKWLYYIIGVVMGIVFDYMYFGAVCRKIKLNYILIIVIVAYNLIYNALYTFLPIQILAEHSNLFIVMSTCYMIIVPIFFTKELLPLAVTYSINSLAQLFTLQIRDMQMLLVTNNFLTMFLMTIETYLWMLLCMIVFNYKRKKEE